MAVRSPHVPAVSILFGTIYRPTAKVEFKVKGRDHWLEIPMVVDTGVDYTILPQWLASDLNVNLELDCEQHTTAGIGGVETVFLFRRMTVRLGRWVGEIPVGFVTRDDVPALLGRQDFSEKLRLIFENYTTTFIVPRPKKQDVS